MRPTPTALALAFAGALSFATVAGAQTDQTGSTGQAGTPGQTGSGGQSGTGVGSGTQTGSGTGDTGQMGSTSSRNSNKSNDDQKFIGEVAIGNLAEIQLSQLAVQNAQDPQVKQFAQMMVDAHTKAKEQLEQVASAGGASLPSELDSKHQKMQSKLSGLNGQEFDREYMKLMVASHKDMESLLKKKANKSASSASGNYGSTSGSSGSATGTSGTSTDTTASTGTSGATASGTTIDAQVGNLARTLLPEVQQHLQQAKDIEKQVSQSGKNSKGYDKGGK